MELRGSIQMLASQRGADFLPIRCRPTSRL